MLYLQEQSKLVSDTHSDLMISYNDKYELVNLSEFINSKSHSLGLEEINATSIALLFIQSRECTDIIASKMDNGDAPDIVVVMDNKMDVWVINQAFDYFSASVSTNDAFKYVYDFFIKEGK